MEKMILKKEIEMLLPTSNSIQDILIKLKSKFSENMNTDEIVKTYIEIKQERRNFWGWLLMLGGGFIGLVSMILTVLDVASNLRGFFMYGLTSIAILIAFYGCYLVLEKGDYSK